MSLSNEDLKQLAQRLAQAMDEYPQQIELVLSTGETLTVEAMNLARLYDKSTGLQRQALDAVAAMIRG